MIKTNTKIGDVFSVKVGDNTEKYFQYIANDLTQLNSDVIRAFTKEFSINEKPTLEEIISGDVEFYAHCVTKFGLKMKLWEKVGNIPFNGKVEVFFRGTNDYGKMVGGAPVKVSDDWYVWKINDKDFTKIGKLTIEYQKAEIGVVVIPQDIVDRMTTGKYNFVHPHFE
ncbi:hypothetical protein [Flavobacterium olei]|uniref:hypothetical protein n=1 Tax=Flavobacterium olei TaxID=1886782 RepID=UPI0032196372